jgi:hypothetical protein
VACSPLLLPQSLRTAKAFSTIPSGLGWCGNHQKKAHSQPAAIAAHPAAHAAARTSIV